MTWRKSRWRPWRVKLGKSIYIQNAVTDPRVSPKFRQFSDVREYCVVPLIGREKVLGGFHRRQILFPGCNFCRKI